MLACPNFSSYFTRFPAPCSPLSASAIYRVITWNVALFHQLPRTAASRRSSWAQASGHSLEVKSTGPLQPTHSSAITSLGRLHLKNRFSPHHKCPAIYRTTRAKNRVEVSELKIQELGSSSCCLGKNSVCVAAFSVSIVYRAARVLFVCKI